MFEMRPLGAFSIECIPEKEEMKWNLNIICFNFSCIVKSRHLVEISN